MLTTQILRSTVKALNDYLIAQYKLEARERERDWKTYEKRQEIKMKMLCQELRPLVEEAAGVIRESKKRGRKPKLRPHQKLLLILIKELCDFSTRQMAFMCNLFSLLSGIEVSRKAVERLYSDPVVEIGLENLMRVLLKKKGVKRANCTGDGTGYALTIRKHYLTVASMRKKEAKEKNKKGCGKRSFVYTFRILDIDTQMYIAYGTSMRSEKEAFEKAVEMLKKIDVEIDKMRLDRYYSSPYYVNKFKDAKVYIIPRKNAKVRGGKKWREMLREFVEEPLQYLREYFLRNNSESAYSADKRTTGWLTRKEKIEFALTCMQGTLAQPPQPISGLILSHSPKPRNFYISHRNAVK